MSMLLLKFPKCVIAKSEKPPSFHYRPLSIHINHSIFSQSSSCLLVRRLSLPPFPPHSQAEHFCLKPAPRGTALPAPTPVFSPATWSYQNCPHEISFVQRDDPRYPYLLLCHSLILFLYLFPRTPEVLLAPSHPKTCHTMSRVLFCDSFPTWCMSQMLH